MIAITQYLLQIPIPTPLPIPPMPPGGINLLDDLLTIPNVERIISAALSIFVLVAQWHNLLLAVVIVGVVVAAVRWIRHVVGRANRDSEI